MENEQVIIHPGDELDKQMHNQPFTYQEGETIYSEVYGILRNNRIIPLQGPYDPQIGDKIIGIITNERHSGYNAFVNMANETSFSSRGMRQQLNIGDVIEAEVENVNEVKNVEIKYPKKMGYGTIMEIPPVKVARVIGKKMSMVNMITEKTDCNIIVGKNGLIWINDCENCNLVIKIINKIISEAHNSGLTARIERYINAEL